MITKTKTALVAALILGSASTAFALDGAANADRATSTYLQGTSAPYARAELYEGRAVGVQRDYQNGIQYQPVNSDQQHWYERAPIDFNS